jgi:hypothetical protein
MPGVRRNVCQASQLYFGSWAGFGMMVGWVGRRGVGLVHRRHVMNFSNRAPAASLARAQSPVGEEVLSQ